MARYYEQQATFYLDDGELVVTDKAVAEYTKKHLRFRDRFNLRKVTECSLMSFSILSKSVEAPPKDKWFYYDDLRYGVDLWS